MKQRGSKLMASKGKKVQEHHRSADFAEPCE